ncbi:hypothetical protein HMPREF0973_00233 [Prevotella veroralis F0319]|uniref:Uncharacterized protein n=1 Tax=Prevotella veroralis F0319 TaxID=649761 RepID=C9MKV9_9BACT|nr:hypothetical protein HMPREF0973_00233 [Prevotella veroralis F0319]
MVLSTPLSIRRGDGGETTLHTEAITELLSAGTFLTQNTRMARSLKATQSSLQNMGIHRS